MRKNYSSNNQHTVIIEAIHCRATGTLEGQQEETKQGMMLLNDIVFLQGLDEYFFVRHFTRGS